MHFRPSGAENTQVELGNWRYEIMANEIVAILVWTNEVILFDNVDRISAENCGKLRKRGVS